MKTDNELIAEFDGRYTTDSKEWVNTNKRFVSQYEYDKSLEWLIPACRKFFQLPVPESFREKTDLNLRKGTLERSLWDYLYGRIEISILHKALSQQIKWYNENKQQ